MADSAEAGEQQQPQSSRGKGFVSYRFGGEADDHKECHRQLGKAKKYPRVQEMVKFIRELGCPINLDEIVSCEPCQVAATGGFIHNKDALPEGQYTPKVVICENYLLGPRYVAQTMVHELIHAYDQCRAKMNWNSCYHIACTEIRASTLSGECDWLEEVDRGNFNIQGQHKACVRRRVGWSLEEHAACKNKAQAVIDQVFARAYKDTAPFEQIP